jgi:hypothetical protein
MAPPAEKTHICPESDSIRPVNRRVGLYGMAQETYRLAIHLFYLSIVIEHIMWIDIRVLITGVTFRTDRPAVGIRAVPQKFLGPFTPGAAMDVVAGQTFHPAIEQREPAVQRFGGNKINRMMVLPVLMAVVADR